MPDLEHEHGLILFDQADRLDDLVALEGGDREEQEARESGAELDEGIGQSDAFGRTRDGPKKRDGCFKTRSLRYLPDTGETARRRS